MINARTLRYIALAVAGGSAWPFVCSELFLAFGLDVLQLQIKTLQNLGIHSAASLKAFIHISDSIIWAVVFGLLFGLPLAAFVRQNVMRYWGLYFSTVLLIVTTGGVLGESKASEFVFDLLFSPFLVYQFGILIVWFFAARTFARHRSNGSIAA